MQFSDIANNVPSLKKSLHLYSHSHILATDLYYFEIYRRILKTINLSHLIQFDAPLCSIIVLMHTSNLFLRKTSDTEKSWCALFTSSE